MENLEVMNNLFKGTYRGRKVAISGHTGFKGSWLALWLTQMGAEVSGFSLDEKGDTSHYSLLKLKLNSHLGDIRKKDELEHFFSREKPEIVFHLAAQSLVRDSYRFPSYTYETNVLGTLNILESARNCESVKAIVNVTTDKVYENNEGGLPFTETDRMGGYDMYSSSKACSELLTASYRNSFFNTDQILLASARAGNVIGGGDWATDRLIPDIYRGVVAGGVTEIRSPDSIRPWQHVLEPLSGYLLLGQNLLDSKSEFAGAWNFGHSEGQTMKVNDVIVKMKALWPEIDYKMNEAESARFHEAGILKLDSSKAIRKLGWKPVWDIRKNIAETVTWYRAYHEEKAIRSVKNLQDYVQDAKKMKLDWTL